MPQRYVHQSYYSWASPPHLMGWRLGFFLNRDEYLTATRACQFVTGIGYRVSFLCVKCGFLGLEIWTGEKKMMTARHPGWVRVGEEFYNVISRIPGPGGCPWVPGWVGSGRVGYPGVGGALRCIFADSRAGRMPLGARVGGVGKGWVPWGRRER